MQIKLLAVALDWKMEKPRAWFTEFELDVDKKKPWDINKETQRPDETLLHNNEESLSLLEREAESCWGSFLLPSPYAAKWTA